MKNAVKLIIFFIIFALFLAGAYYFLNIRARVPDNESSKTGNSASNLYNEGLFCEDDDDGLVYFSNPYDGGALYVMNPDESGIKKLEKYDTKWINSAGNHLYYYQAADGSNAIAGFGGHMMGVYRSDKKGRHIKCLDKTTSGTIALAGNYLYYEHYTNTNKEGMTLYKMRIDKTDGGQVAKEIIDPSCVYNGSIYYAGTNGDHSLYRLDTATDNAAAIFEGTVWNPVLLSDGDTLFYMNVMDKYRLYRASLSSGEETRLTDDRVDCFNVTDSYIYYQKNDKDEPALMRCRLDGSDNEVVATGIYTHLNSTSRYLYFQRFDDYDSVFHTPVAGPVAVSEFGGARSAVE